MGEHLCKRRNRRLRQGFPTVLNFRRNLGKVTASVRCEKLHKTIFGMEKGKAKTNRQPLFSKEERSPILSAITKDKKDAKGTSKKERQKYLLKRLESEVFGDENPSNSLNSKSRGKELRSSPAVQTKQITSQKPQIKGEVHFELFQPQPRQTSPDDQETHLNELVKIKQFFG